MAVQVTEEELVLRSQFVTLEPGKGRHNEYLPHAFTEQGPTTPSKRMGFRTGQGEGGDA